MVRIYILLLFIFILYTLWTPAWGPAWGQCPAALSQTNRNLSPNKPTPLAFIGDTEQLRRLLSGENIIDVWSSRSEVMFVAASLIAAPLDHARPLLLDFSLYKKMSPHIQFIEHERRAGIVRIMISVGGYNFHSIVRIDELYWDEVHAEVLSGPLRGYQASTYLWEYENGKTLAIARGHLRVGTLAKWICGPLCILGKMVLTDPVSKLRSYIENALKK